MQVVEAGGIKGDQPGSAGAAGSGGGGAGGKGAAGSAACANTGGGGGGSGRRTSPASNFPGGAGGSGIVVVKELDKASGIWSLEEQLDALDEGTWPRREVDIDYLIVGGGAGGGRFGGGGAGGYRASGFGPSPLQGTAQTLGLGSYTITVGCRWCWRTRTSSPWKCRISFNIRTYYICRWWWRWFRGGSPPGDLL